MPTLAQPTIPAFRTPIPVVAGIIAVSATASLFLAWLVYFHAPVDLAGTHLTFLPALNAVLNTCCTIALLFGLHYIRRRAITAHRNSMFTAFLFSSLFLACYIANYALHGESHFHGHGPIRPAYFTLLISHITLSVIALPMILITFFFSLSGRFHLHRTIARYTYPIWLYVSVTGVIVYAMLAVYR